MESIVLASQLDFAWSLIPDEKNTIIGDSWQSGVYLESPGCEQLRGRRKFYIAILRPRATNDGEIDIVTVVETVEIVEKFEFLQRRIVFGIGCEIIDED